MTTRDIVVAGALQRQQVRSYLKAMGIEYEERMRKYDARFRFDATEAQWGQIQEWVKKVTR